MSGPKRSRSGLMLLLRLDRRRIAASLRRPSVEGALGLLLPGLLLVGLAWAAGDAAVPAVRTAGDGAALGMLVGGSVAFLTYGTLFRAPDAPFLRRLGVPQRAIFAERAGRLLSLALPIALAPVVVAGIAGRPVGALLPVSIATGVAGWALGLGAITLAARALARQARGQGWGCLAVGMWDGELAAAAPLVHAPLLPLLGTGAAGGLVAASPGASWVRALAVVAGSVGLAWISARWWEQAIPRFAPRVLEMAFAPPPPSGAGELRVGRGLARLLPRRAAAVWARDSVVAGRRFAWATRLAWPVAVLGVVGLARWGSDPDTRRWVAGAAMLVWTVQALAMMGLGRAEAAGRRWIDRTLGITPVHRLLGRWAWGWGMGLWVAVPLSLAWQWWSGAGSGWPWLAVPAATAAVGAAGSVAMAGWR